MITLRRGVATAIACLTVAVLGAGAPALAHPGQPPAQFDPNEVAWGSFRDVDKTTFDTYIAGWQSGGYLIVDLEADAFEGVPKFGAALQRNIDGREWMADTVMTQAQYNAASALAQQRNMRLVDREIYTYNNGWYFAAVWLKNLEGYTTVSKYGMTLGELGVFTLQQEHASRIPIDFDMYPTSSGMRYSAVFLDNPQGLDWELLPDLSLAQFAAADTDHGNNGFRTIAIDSARDGVNLRFGAFWWENANGRSWASRVHANRTDYDNWWHELDDSGFRKIFIGRFNDGGKIGYLSTWRQNNSRHNWDLRLPVGFIVDAEMDEDDLPGVSVAIMQNGQFRLARGYGYADLDAGIKMDSTHVLRTASISKAIGGALALRLTERSATDRLDRNDFVKEWLGAWMTDHAKDEYQFTNLELLASNRGCVRHYASSETYTDPEEEQAQRDADDVMGTTSYNSAREALSEYIEDDLVCIPDTYHYSTLSMGVLASMLEVATNKTTPVLVRDEITKPLGLATLRCENLADTAVNRAKAYKGEDNDEADLLTEQKSSSPLGGGIESNAADLARFGHALITGQVIANPEYIWSGTPWNDYAYGWNLLSDEDGHRRVGKSGGSLGADSYLLAYPDDDIVIAVLINREELNESDNNAKDIAVTIGSMMI